jgi:hypothetical protein
MLSLLSLLLLLLLLSNLAVIVALLSHALSDFSLSLLLKHAVPIFFVGGDDVDTPPWAELATLSLLFPSRE